VWVNDLGEAMHEANVSDSEEGNRLWDGRE
jgi:hypothetical protein